MTDELKPKKKLGRKPIEDPLEREFVSFRRSEVKKYGGWEKLIEKIYKTFRKKN